jgi:hypothetical protein
MMRLLYFLLFVTLGFNIGFDLSFFEPVIDLTFPAFESDPCVGIFSPHNFASYLGRRNIRVTNFHYDRK